MLNKTVKNRMFNETQKPHRRYLRQHKTTMIHTRKKQTNKKTNKNKHKQVIFQSNEAKNTVLETQWKKNHGKVSDNNKKQAKQSKNTKLKTLLRNVQTK